MKDINWSKWIAIALSVFILVQVVQVSFLAANRGGGGGTLAGVDASRGSLAEEIISDVWDRVGDTDSIILKTVASDGAISDEAITDTVDPAGLDDRSKASEDTSGPKGIVYEPLKEETLLEQGIGNADDSLPADGNTENDMAGRVQDGEDPAEGDSRDGEQEDPEGQEGAPSDDHDAAASEGSGNADQKEASKGSGVKQSAGSASVGPSALKSGSETKMSGGGKALESPDADAGISAAATMDEVDGSSSAATMDEADGSSNAATMDATDSSTTAAAKDAADGSSTTASKDAAESASKDAAAGASAAATTDTAHASPVTSSGVSGSISLEGVLIHDAAGVSSGTADRIKWTVILKGLTGVGPGGFTLEVKSMNGHELELGPGWLPRMKNRVEPLAWKDGGTSQNSIVIPGDVTGTPEITFWTTCSKGQSIQINRDNDQVLIGAENKTAKKAAGCTVTLKRDASSVSSGDVNVTDEAESGFVRLNEVSLNLKKWNGTGDGGLVTDSKSSFKLICDQAEEQEQRVLDGRDIILHVDADGAGLVTADGLSGDEKLYPGRYCLSATALPKGYITKNRKNRYCFAVELDDNGDAKLIYDTDADGGWDALGTAEHPAPTVYIEELKSCEIRLVDQNNEHLTGVRMTLNGRFTCRTDEGVTYTEDTSDTKTGSGGDSKVFNATWVNGAQDQVISGLVVGETYKLTATGLPDVKKDEATWNAIDYIEFTLTDSMTATPKAMRRTETASVEDTQAPYYSSKTPVSPEWTSGTSSALPRLTVVYQCPEARLNVKLVDKTNAAFIPKNAKYQLYYSDADTAPTTRESYKADVLVSATDKGYLSFTGLRPGHYYIAENTTPVGYIANDKIYCFSVSKDGALKGNTTPISGAEALTGASKDTIEYTERAAILKITRTDLVKATDLPEGGVLYTLYNGTTPVEEKALSAGAVSWTNLKWGVTYRLVETTTPSTTASGRPYSKDTGEHTILFDPNGPTVTPETGYSFIADTMELSVRFSTLPSVSVQVYLNTEPLGTRASVPLKLSSGNDVIFTLKGDMDTTGRDVGFSGGSCLLTGLTPGETYTLTQMTTVGGFWRPSFRFAIDGTTGKIRQDSITGAIPSGLAVIAQNAGDTAASGTGTVDKPTLYVYEPYMALELQFVIDCAESGYASVTSGDGYAVTPGISFGVYTMGADNKLAAPGNCYDENGKAVNTMTTDAQGFLTLYGVNLYKTDPYYIKLLTNKAEGDYRNLVIDNTTVLVVTPDGNGHIAKVESKTGSGSIKPSKRDNTVLVGTVKRGRLTFHAVEIRQNSSGSTNTSSVGSTTFSYSKVASASFNIYRARDYGRENYKLAGSTGDMTLNSFSTSTKKDANGGYFYSVKANIRELMDRLDSFLVMEACAETTTYEWDGNTWELLGTGTSDENGLVSFSGLIPGQRYLVRENTSTDYQPVIFNTSGTLSSSGDALTITSACDYNTDKTSPMKIITRDSSGYRWLTTTDIQNAGSSTSNASTSRSGATAGASGATIGSGRGANAGSGAAAARGSATGDDSRLWIHLVIMLISFDALVADLLYISRNKKRSRVRIE